MSFGRTVAIVAAMLIAGTTVAQTASPPPAVRKQIFAAAGYFTGRDGRLLNSCGQPANPGAVMVDLNRDGVAEAVVMDAGGCYKDGRHFAIAYRNRAGVWLGLIRQDGTVKAATTSTGGWRDMDVTLGGRTVRYAYQSPDGVGVYLPATTAAASAPVVAPPAAGPAPTTLATLTPADRTAIFTAAGAKRFGKVWKMCEEEPSASATIEKLWDANGDGRPEALITESGTFCWGRDEAGFALITRTPDGRWSRLEGGQGIAEFKPPKGVDGWPDLEIGGPGFCFPVSRWNGKEFALHHFNEYMKGNCADNGHRPAVRAY